MLINIYFTKFYAGFVFTRACKEKIEMTNDVGGDITVYCWSLRIRILLAESGHSIL